MWSMALRQDERLKATFAEILRADVMDRERNLPWDEVRAPLTRRAEDRFKLVVVGPFSSSNTTHMNGMVGTDRLPTGILAVTSVSGTVNYRGQERVVPHYQHTNVFLEIPLPWLAVQLTKHCNAGNVHRILTAKVPPPSECVWRQGYLIDTPDLDSSILENVPMTEAFLADAGGNMLVTSSDCLHAEEGGAALKGMRRSGRHVFVVLNRQDSVSEAERTEAFARLRERLVAIFGGLSRALHLLSSRQAHELRRKEAKPVLEASGLPAFETTLLGSLLNEEQSEFQLRIWSWMGEMIGTPTDTQTGQRRLTALPEDITAVHPERVIVGTAMSIRFGFARTEDLSARRRCPFSLPGVTPAPSPRRSEGTNGVRDAAAAMWSAYAAIGGDDRVERNLRQFHRSGGTRGGLSEGGSAEQTLKPVGLRIPHRGIAECRELHYVGNGAPLVRRVRDGYSRAALACPGKGPEEPLGDLSLPFSVADREARGHRPRGLPIVTLGTPVRTADQGYASLRAKARCSSASSDKEGRAHRNRARALHADGLSRCRHAAIGADRPDECCPTNKTSEPRL